MRKYSFILIMLCSYLLLTACGTKGPLYIPEQRYPQKTQDEAPAKASQDGAIHQDTKEHE